MQNNIKDWAGKRVGFLTILGLSPLSKPGKPRWNVRCDCGAEKEMASSEITRKRHKGVRMCQAWCPVGGEAIRKAKVTHGGKNLGEYKVWRGIKLRCHVKSNPSYDRYGGSGIFVCPEWKNDFARFFQDMGPRPAPGMSIDRIDGKKGYSPDNCRWATIKQQANNRSNNVFVDTPWGKLTVAIAAEKAGIPYSLFLARVRQGENGKDIFRPVHKHNRRFQTKWGELTVIEACNCAGILPKTAYSRLKRGITDPEKLFSVKDLRGAGLRAARKPKTKTPP